MTDATDPLALCTLRITACSSDGFEYYPKPTSGARQRFLNYNPASLAGMSETFVRHEGEERIHDTLYLKIVSVSNKVETQEIYTRFDTGGVYVRYCAHPESGEARAFPAAVATGTTWGVLRGSDLIRYSVSSDTTTMETALRTYKNCLRIDYDGSVGGRAVRGYSYRAPGVGEVAGMWLSGDARYDFMLAEESRSWWRFW